MSWNTSKKEEKLRMTFEERKKLMLAQGKERRERDRNHLLVGVYAEAKFCKSGSVVDCRTDEEIEEGMEVHILDLDDGCTPTVKANWPNDENIHVHVPNVMRDNGTQDWEETFENCLAIISIMQEAVATGNVKAVALDGVDKLLEGSSKVLRESLVNMNQTLVQVQRDTAKLKVKALDWQIRNDIYDMVLNPILLMDCDRYIITHEKPVYDGIGVPVPIGTVPDWYKTTPHKLLQMVRLTKVRRGINTVYVATLDACKNNPSAVGTTWDVFHDNKETPNEWKGIPYFKTGVFE
jgi:hypothetical protein